MATKKPEVELHSYVHKWYSLQALARDLASSDKVVSRVKTLRPDTDPEQVLRAMREKYAALEKELKERTTMSLRRAGEYQKAEARPFTTRRDTPIAVDSSVLISILDKLSPRCPDLTIGQVKANAFNHYQWHNKNQGSSSEFMAFWPYGQYPSQLPDSTAFTSFGYQDEGVACYVFATQAPGTMPLFRLLNPHSGDHFYTISAPERDNAISGVWSGEIGAWFVGWLRVQPQPGLDPVDYISHAGVLQFTIPGPKCDSIIYWGTTGHAVAWNWIVTVDHGSADAWWLLHESPDGAGFPSKEGAFESFGPMLWKTATGDTKTSDDEVWNRSFRVKAGVAARIYLGMGCLFGGINGNIEAPGLASYFKVDYGITYFMVPDVFQPM